MLKQMPNIPTSLFTCCISLPQMGTFDETAIVRYLLSFIDQRRQTSIFCFCLQQTNRSLLFQFFVCSKQTKQLFSFGSVFRIYIYMTSFRFHDEQTINGLRKIAWTFIFRFLFEKAAYISPGSLLNLFTICSLCKQKFVDGPFVHEETNGSYLFANILYAVKKLNGLVQLCSLP